MKKMELVLVKGRIEKNFFTLLPMATVTRYSGNYGTEYIIVFGFLIFTLDLRFVKGGRKWQEK